MGVHGARGHADGGGAGSRAGAARALECEGEDGRGAAVDAGGRRRRGEAGGPEAGGEGLKKRHGEGEARLLKQAQAKVGELAMQLELVELLLEKRGYGEELARLKKS